MSISKKTISIICAAVLTLCAVVGGVVFCGMRTKASGTQMTVAAESSTVGKDEEIKVCVTASSGESMSYIKADLTYDPAMLELVGTTWLPEPMVRYRLLRRWPMARQKEPMN